MFARMTTRVENIGPLLLAAATFLTPACNRDRESACAPFYYNAALDRCTCFDGSIVSDGGLCVAVDGGAHNFDDGAIDATCLGCGTCSPGDVRPCPDGTDQGECVAGAQQCTATGWSACVGGVGASTEACNGLDDDCDGFVDGPAARAACGSAPRVTSAACNAGLCQATSCTAGWDDCDREFSNGCETEIGTTNACLACGDRCGWDCDPMGCNDGITLASGGSHSCAVRDDGVPLCWGDNAVGQMGDGTTTDRATPVAVALSGAAQVALGGAFSCARLHTGSVRCWGGNSSGALGDGTTTSRATPAAVTGLSTGVTALAAGNGHACAVAGGGLRCWGWNMQGQLGDGTTANRSSAGIPSGLASGVVSVATGASHTCAVLSSGAVRCFGDNQFGQLGDGSMTDRLNPVSVSGLPGGVTAITAGASHTCVIINTGEVLCWGRNGGGQLGDGTVTHRSAPTRVTALPTTALAITAGSTHTCVLLADARIACWGYELRGQLGDGGTVSGMRTRPQLVVGVDDAVAVDAGDEHTCALHQDGRVTCWGYAADGRLGDGTGLDSPTPSVVLPP